MEITNLNGLHRPSAVEIGQRALAIRTLIARAGLEYAYQDEDAQEDEDWEAEFDGFRSWLSSEGKIYNYLTVWEFQLVTQPLGTWTVDDFSLNGGYWMEALGVLFWVLDKVKLSNQGESYDQQYLVYEYPNLDSSEMFLKDLQVRPANEIVKARDFTFACFLRLFKRICQLDESQQSVALQNLNPEILTELAARNGISGMMPGDLSWLNQAVEFQSDEDALNLFMSLKVRLAALNWTLGVFSDWEWPVYTFGD